MARVTVEDCIIKVPNRFELVILAARRSKELTSGINPTVPRDHDKNPVIALREVAEETIDINALKESVIDGARRTVVFENLDEDHDEGENEEIADSMSAHSFTPSAEDEDSYAEEDGFSDFADDESAEDEDF